MIVDLVEQFKRRVAGVFGLPLPEGLQVLVEPEQVLRWLWLVQVVLGPLLQSLVLPQLWRGPLLLVQVVRVLVEPVPVLLWSQFLL